MREDRVERFTELAEGVLGIAGKKLEKLGSGMQRFDEMKHRRSRGGKFATTISAPTPLHNGYGAKTHEEFLGKMFGSADRSVFPVEHETVQSSLKAIGRDDLAAEAEKMMHSGGFGYVASPEFANKVLKAAGSEKRHKKDSRSVESGDPDSPSPRPFGNSDVKPKTF